MGFLLVFYASCAALALVFPLMSLMMTLWIRLGVERVQQQVMGSLQTLFAYKFKQDFSDPLNPTSVSTGGPLEQYCTAAKLVTTGDESFWRVRARQLEIDAETMSSNLERTVRLYHHYYPIAQLFLWLGVLNSVLTCIVLLGLYFDANFEHTQWMWMSYCGLMTLCACLCVVFTVMIVREGAQQQHEGYGSALEFADAELRKDREVVLASVASDGMTLEHATDFQNDRAVVLAAVKQKGNALQFAHDDLRADREIADAAMIQDLTAAQYVGDALWDDASFVISVVKRDCSLLRFASDAVRADRNVVMEALGKETRKKPSRGREVLRRATTFSGASSVMEPFLRD